MEKEKLSEKFLQSYLYTVKFGNFFVSTIHRKSSALMGGEQWFYETFAWNLDDKGERDGWIADNSGAKFMSDAIKQHTEVLKQLEDKGVFNYKEHDTI